MEPDLEQFLKEREAVTEDILTTMKLEKIDKAVIRIMTEEELKKFIPKMGDRIAVIRYCKAGIESGSHNRLSLIERIRINQTKSNPNATQISGSCTSSSLAKKPNIKPTRIITIGWIMDGKPVRERNGGGTRNCSIAKNAKKQEILDQAQIFFFPNGVSSNGKILSRFTYDLLDYKEHTFDNTLTVGEMYQITGLNVLRFYLSTNSIEYYMSSPEETTNSKKRVKRTLRTRIGKRDKNSVKEQDLIENVLAESEVYEELTADTERPYQSDVFSDLQEFLNTDTEEFSKIETNVESCVSSIPSTLVPADVAFIFPRVDACVNGFNNQEGVSTTQQLLSTLNGPSQQQQETFSVKQTLTLHRGQIFKEMTAEFINIENLNTYIDVEIIGSNGVKEEAYDGGGVFKDALTEYWAEFYESICEGTSCKIPEINHLVTQEKWKAIAKVLLVGYKLVKYFPIKIPRPFIEYATFGKEKSDLITAYLKFLPPVDADVLRNALLSFENTDSDELIDVLSNIECKQIVNSGNINTVVYDLAHTALLQKPMFILDCWADILKNSFTNIDIDDIYERCEVTNKSVLQLFVTYDAELSSDKEKIMFYLKKFTREVDYDTLCRFLRFCTGADIITCNNIQIEFSHLTGAERRPTSHTCNNILVLPLSYASDTYRAFKFEFMNILKSNMWCMDIV